MEKFKLTLVMLLWGSIGIFTRNIELSPVVLAFLRAIVSLPILTIIIFLKKSYNSIVFKDMFIYILSGAMIGLAWAALFFGYKNTNVSLAIVIYNMCPVYVMMLSPLILKERLSKLQVTIIGISFTGLIFVIGLITLDHQHLSGILFSGASGILYATIVIMNRKFNSKMDHNLSTLVQMAAATFVLIPFVLMEGGLNNLIRLDIKSCVFVLVLGTIHTGIAYNLYFSVYSKLSSMEIASYSYLEPAFGIILSMLILHETMTIQQMVGVVLILGSTYFGEYMRSLKTIRTID